MAHIAINILYAVRSAVFDATGDGNYAIQKGNQFLDRCGAKVEAGPQQEISDTTIQQAAFAVLDEDTVKAFYAGLPKR